jgi:hypothetical protein
VATTPKAILVDIRALFDQITASGYSVDGRNLDTSYLGGLFSLDGIHPTNTAYGVIAQYFINAMNTDLHTHIPGVPLPLIALQDPMVFPILSLIF